MPVTVSCTQCGKQLNVKDEYIGKRLKCPQCGATFTAAERPRAKPSAKDKMPTFHISKGIVILVAVVILLPSVFAIYHYGPGRVSDEWIKNLPDSEDRVKDVVTRGLQAYLSMHDEFDPTIVHQPPHALDITFLFGPMYMSTPATVGFAGTTTSGAFSGNYHPKTLEVEADVELGGMAIQGVGAVKRGNKTFHVTGRERDSKLTIEIDGKPADIVWPKHIDER